MHTLRGAWQIPVGLLILFVALAPFAWATSIAFTPEDAQFAHSVRYIPPALTLDNFVQMFVAANFGHAFMNSVFVATVVTLLAVAVSITAGYAFARFRFWGRRALIISLLMIYLLPSILLLVPMMVIFRTLGILNTYPALILAEASHAIPFGVWLLTNYFSALPPELEEAAQVDGCTRVGAMVRVALPIAIPGIIAAALFVFIASWNDFLFAFMFTSGDDVRTLPVLLRRYVVGETGVRWGAVMAGAVMTTVPVAAAFLVFQRYLIGGLTSGAVKG